jgi:hypothetical protein
VEHLRLWFTLLILREFKRLGCRVCADYRLLAGDLWIGTCLGLVLFNFFQLMPVVIVPKPSYAGTVEESQLYTFGTERFRARSKNGGSGHGSAKRTVATKSGHDGESPADESLSKQSKLGHLCFRTAITGQPCSKK